MSKPSEVENHVRANRGFSQALWTPQSSNFRQFTEGRGTSIILKQKGCNGGLGTDRGGSSVPPVEAGGPPGGGVGGGTMRGGAGGVGGGALELVPSKRLGAIGGGFQW